jgi:hypothetical protein
LGRINKVKVKACLQRVRHTKTYSLSGKYVNQVSYVEMNKKKFEDKNQTKQQITAYEKRQVSKV